MQVNGTQPAGQVHGPHGLSGPHAGRAARQATPPSKATPDQLDISTAASEAADAAADAAESDGVRADLVARIRGEIADGSYETPEKLNAAVDRLFDEIG